MSIGSNPNVGYSIPFLTDAPAEIGWLSSRFADACLDGRAYSFSTAGFSTIATALFETGILYAKNTHATESILIHSIEIGGDQVTKWRLYKNPTTGLLISNAIAGGEENLKFDSTETADADVFKGTEADTVTDGSVVKSEVTPVGSLIIPYGGGIILAPDDSIALTADMVIAGDVFASMDVFFDSI